MAPHERSAFVRPELWERDGTTLTVSGLDAIDRSPVLDIKPYVGEFFPQNDVSVPEWMERIMGEFRGV